MTLPFNPREVLYPRHLSAVAATLLDLADQVEGLGSRLCADPALVANHAHEMQLFDLVSQMHKELASLLDADCPACAASRLQLDALRERVQESLPHVNCNR